MFDAVEKAVLRATCATADGIEDASSLACLFSRSADDVRAWCEEQRAVASLPHNVVLLTCVYAATLAPDKAVGAAHSVLAALGGADADAFVRNTVLTHVAGCAQMLRVRGVNPEDSVTVAVSGFVQRVAEVYGA